MSEVTRILEAIEQGHAVAADELLPMVYDELRRLAAKRISHEAPGQTLSATALVHEAYLRLVGSAEVRWENRRHFFAAAAESMRRILIDNARCKQSVKHGGQLKQQTLDDALVLSDAPNEEILALHEALERLAELDKVKADIVTLRYFAGLTISEVAKVLDISPASVDRYWAYARAWLHQEVSR